MRRASSGYLCRQSGCDSRAVRKVESAATLALRARVAGDLNPALGETLLYVP